MRVRRVEVNEWRNLRDIAIEIPADTNMVCLIGENGSGKSAVLELISSVAHRLGISPGVDIPRGDPFADPHRFTVTVTVPSNLRDVGEVVLAERGLPEASWDGSLQLTSSHAVPGASGTDVIALGIADQGAAREMANRVVAHAQQIQETQHLFLDADRSYPPVQIQPHQLGEIWSQDWESPSLSRQWAYRPTKTLYEEWNKYFLGKEARAAEQFVAAIRRARQAQSDEPAFVDPFDEYREAVNHVLPHLHFVGVQTSGTNRSLVFDSAGLELAFHKLSGGEREIAFLIGQIERFKLRQGLLMIDEPELHLNPDLLRTWVAFLRDTVEDGQVWLATHSLEAVEVAGPESSFVFEKNAAERITRSVQPLSGRPVVSALSAAIGAPAFSLSNLRFTYVEGDRHRRERERFYDVAGDPHINRFIEGGSCHEVLRRLDDVRGLARETGEQLHVGAVIDRDFRSDEEAAAIASESGAHVLQCHEIENVFLDPLGLDALLSRAGEPSSARDIIRNGADAFAGLWVAQKTDSLLPQLSETPKATMASLSSLNWDTLSANSTSSAAAGSQYFGDPAEGTMWSTTALKAIEEYRAVRESPELWRDCLGKQTLGRVAQALGYSSADVLQRRVLALWADAESGVEPPEAVATLRRYLQGLGGT